LGAPVELLVLIGVATLAAVLAWRFLTRGYR
jgi:hypothetical protein